MIAVRAGMAKRLLSFVIGSDLPKYETLTRPEPTELPRGNHADGKSIARLAASHLMGADFHLFRVDHPVALR
jgi:hypothetical protein